MACKVGSFTKVLSLKVSFVDSLTLKMVPKNKQTDLGTKVVRYVIAITFLVLE